MQNSKDCKTTPASNSNLWAIKTLELEELEKNPLERVVTVIFAPRKKDYTFALNQLRANSKGYLESLTNISQSLSAEIKSCD